VTWPEAPTDQVRVLPISSLIGVFVPQVVFVEGETSRWRPEGQPGVRVVGKLYNWDWESMPEPVGDGHLIDWEHFINSTRIPLNFVGRVKVVMGENATCHGVKLGLHRSGKEIMLGATHSADGQFKMVAENGGLVELMEPLSEWFLTVEHTCTRDGASLSQKFAFANSKQLDEEYLKLKPVS